MLCSRAQVSLQAQQKDYVDALMAPIRHALEGAMGALRGALDGRVYVAVGRALWDYVGKDLYEFVEGLQVGGVSSRNFWKLPSLGSGVTRDMSGTMLLRSNHVWQMHKGAKAPCLRSPSPSDPYCPCPALPPGLPTGQRRQRRPAHQQGCLAGAHARHIVAHAGQ